MKRVWINQPSASQPWHDQHGTNVLACEKDYTPGTVVIYYLSGPIVSAVVSRLWLSDGWV